MRIKRFFSMNKLLPFSAIALVASVGSSCNLDPVHRSSVNNLGDEQTDLYPEKSQYHRPGEPCALCHSKEGPADSQFVLAGTIFWGPDNYDRRVPNAYVRVIDANGAKKCFVTNCNGNFYVQTDQFAKPTFPMLVSVEVTKDPGRDNSTVKLRTMGGHIGRESSCATCHIQGLRDYGSPGQIRIYDTEDDAKAGKTTTPCGDEAADKQVLSCPEDQ